MRSQKVTILTSESIDKFHNWCIARGQSRNTAKAYSTDLKIFLQWTEMPVIQMNHFEEIASSWLNATREKMAPKTTNRRLTSLRAFATWTGMNDALSWYKAPTPGKGTPHPIPEGLDGLERMLAVAQNYEQEALVGLTGFAGLRVHEALACETTWIDLDNMMIRVRGKGDKERIVPLSQRTWGAIASAYVMAASTRNTKLIRYQDRSARKVITTLGRRAGLSRAVASHDMRATFATVVYDKTLDQRVVQELLGHASGATTELYIGVSNKKMRGAVDF